MKKTLVILSLIVLSGCMKKFGPDESTISQGNALRLPPEYELKAPKNVKTIKKEEKTSEVKSQEILLNKPLVKAKNDKNVNSWVLKNAGGEKRIKNIKEILKQDLILEQQED